MRYAWFSAAAVFLAACSPEGEKQAPSGPSATGKEPQNEAAPNTGGPVLAESIAQDPAAVPYKKLGWDSATSRFLLDDKPFTGVTIDFYKPSGNPPVAKLKARYHITEGLNDGFVEEWHENGRQKTKTSYVKGQHQGDNFYWNPDGTLLVHKVWKDNVLISETPGKGH